jgi:hypothetical protein
MTSWELVVLWLILAITLPVSAGATAYLITNGIYAAWLKHAVEVADAIERLQRLNKNGREDGKAA